jgi:uncharacterized SAM-binding protein YcdF (DUF218 family)
VSRRLIAVLGYSNGGDSLHPVCAARLARAQEEARADDAVLLSGWARHPHVPTEAELMAAAWQGANAELVLAPDARTTLGNAGAAVETALRLSASEILLVTSRWHARRATHLFKVALRGTGIGLRIAPADGPRPRGVQVRELVCWALLPAQLALTRRARRRPSDTVLQGTERGVGG